MALAYGLLPFSEPDVENAEPTKDFGSGTASDKTSRRAASVISPKASVRVV